MRNLVGGVMTPPYEGVYKQQFYAIQTTIAADWLFCRRLLGLLAAETGVEGGQAVDFFRQCICNHTIFCPPCPVGICGSGEIHSGLGSQIQVILQRNHAGIGNAAHGGADDAPDQALFLGQPHVFRGVFLHLGGAALQPGGHVVVGTGVAQP